MPCFIFLCCGKRSVNPQTLSSCLNLLLTEIFGCGSGITGLVFGGYMSMHFVQLASANYGPNTYNGLLKMFRFVSG
jgi:hypothetical protein